MMEPDQLPAHNLEAEQCALGCVLLDADGKGAVLDDLIEKIGSRGPEVFYDLRHRTLYQALCEMHRTGKPVDIASVCVWLTGQNALESIGGMAYVSGLADAAPSSASLEFFVDTILDRYALRSMQRLCVETAHEARDYTGSAMDLVSKFQADAVALTDAHVPSKFRHIKPGMLRLAELLETRRRGRQQITGIATQFWYLNNMTAGLQPSEFVVIGARPSTGKTALGIDLAMHAGLNGVPVLFFSLEMIEESILLRMVSSNARIDGMKLRNGFWRDSKEKALVAAIGRVAKLPIYIDDRSALTGQDVMIATRRAVREHGVKMIVVDYIQLMKSARKYNSRQEEVAEASSYLKRIGKEMGVVVVGLAQLSRDTEKERAGRRPLMSDLKESGAIEQDADVIGLLWEPKLDPDDEQDMKWLQYHDPDDPKDDPTSPETWKDWFRRINLTIAKQRNGATGDCELVFQKKSTRFVDAYSPQRTGATA